MDIIELFSSSTKKMSIVFVMPFTILAVYQVMVDLIHGKMYVPAVNKLDVTLLRSRHRDHRGLCICGRARDPHVDNLLFEGR